MSNKTLLEKTTELRVECERKIAALHAAENASPAQQCNFAPPPPAVRPEPLTIEEMVEREAPNTRADVKWLSGKPIRALPILRDYCIGGHKIPAGDYLLELLRSDNSEKIWVPMSREYIEREYVDYNQPVARTDSADGRYTHIPDGLKFATYDPEAEDVHIMPKHLGVNKALKRAQVEIQCQHQARAEIDRMVRQCTSKIVAELEELIQVVS